MSHCCCIQRQTTALLSGHQALPEPLVPEPLVPEPLVPEPLLVSHHAVSGPSPSNCTASAKHSSVPCCSHRSPFQLTVPTCSSPAYCVTHCVTHGPRLSVEQEWYINQISISCQWVDRILPSNRNTLQSLSEQRYLVSFLQVSAAASQFQQTLSTRVLPTKGRQDLFTSIRPTSGCDGDAHSSRSGRLGKT